MAQGGPGSGERPRWGREQVETVIIGKFATELNLSPEQAEKFFPRFRQFQDQTEGLQRQQVERRAQFDMLAADPQANPEQVSGLISAQSQYEQQLSSMKRAFLGDISEYLTPQQVSRCSILLDELPRKVHQYMEERGRGRGRGSPPNPHPRRSN